MTKKVTNKILTLSNLILFARLLLVPIFAVLLMGYQNEKPGDTRYSTRNSKAARQASSARRRIAPGNTQKVRRQAQDNRQGVEAVLQIVNTPKKMLITIAILLPIVALGGFYGFDGIRNFGVIHQGVRVGTVDVGQMKEADAAELLTEELTTQALSAAVNLFASEQAAISGVDENTLQLGNGVNAFNSTEVNQEVVSWSINLGTLNAEVNGAQLAREAYSVGRSSDFLWGRIAVNMFGVTITPRFDYAEGRLRYLEGMLTQSIGRPMYNASMHFDGERFIVVDGQDGRVVDEEQFEAMLQRAFFAANRELVVPMVDRAMRVNRESAEQVAQNTQQTISQPITLTYADASWILDPGQLGAIISSKVELKESGNWELVPTVDARLLAAIVPGIIGQIENQREPVNAKFIIFNKELQIDPGQDGAGVDYSHLMQNLNAVLFGHESAFVTSGDIAKRTIPLRIGSLAPTLQASDLATYDFAKIISESTLYYPSVPPQSVINIHVCSDHISSSIIAPQTTWSLIETVGEFTPENGFVDSQTIVDGVYVDGMGDGVCTVASVVFNAVYEAGYPIVERVNHFLRATRYPLGRDATIAYPHSDFKFKNDTDNYLLLTISYTNDSITCILWGIPPGYRVESITGELIEGADFERREVFDRDLAPGERVVEQEGLRASRVEVTRIVYDAQGNLKSKATFYSSYDSTPEITRVGPEPSRP